MTTEVEDNANKSATINTFNNELFKDKKIPKYRQPDSVGKWFVDSKPILFYTSP